MVTKKSKVENKSRNRRILINKTSPTNIIIKKCRRCLVVKNSSEFSIRLRNKDGLRGECKKCCSDSSNKSRREKVYNLLECDYKRLKKFQSGKCALCGDKYKKLVIDHNYTFGYVRGMLCSKCNNGLGMFNDDCDLLKKAIDYLIDPPACKLLPLHMEKKGNQ